MKWKPSSTLEYSYVNGENIHTESHLEIFSRRAVSAMILFLAILVVIGLAAVNAGLYSYVANQMFFNTSIVSTYGLVGSIGIVSIAAAIIIVLAKRV
jgi:hypothetical protein